MINLTTEETLCHLNERQQNQMNSEFKDIFAICHALTQLAEVSDGQSIFVGDLKPLFSKLDRSVTFAHYYAGEMVTPTNDELN